MSDDFSTTRYRLPIVINYDDSPYNDSFLSRFSITFQAPIYIERYDPYSGPPQSPEDSIIERILQCECTNTDSRILLLCLCPMLCTIIGSLISLMINQSNSNILALAFIGLVLTIPCLLALIYPCFIQCKEVGRGIAEAFDDSSTDV